MQQIAQQIKMKKIIIISIILMFLSILIIGNISLITAEQVDKDLIINIQCSNSTYANITSIIYKTNSTYILKGEYAMTKLGTNYNYTLNETLNNKIGILEVNYHCDLNNLDTSAGYLITVTSTGNETSLTQSFVMFFLIGIILLVAVVFFIFGLKNEYVPIKIFCLAMSIILIVFLIGYVLSISNIVLGEYTSLNNTFSVLYILFIALLSVGGFGIIVYLIVLSLKSFAKYRGFSD